MNYLEKDFDYILLQKEKEIQEIQNKKIKNLENIIEENLRNLDNLKEEIEEYKMEIRCKDLIISQKNDEISEILSNSLKIKEIFTKKQLEIDQLKEYLLEKNKIYENELLKKEKIINEIKEYSQDLKFKNDNLSSKLNRQIVEKNNEIKNITNIFLQEIDEFKEKQIFLESELNKFIKENVFLNEKENNINEENNQLIEKLNLFDKKINELLKENEIKDSQIKKLSYIFEKNKIDEELLNKYKNDITLLENSFKKLQEKYLISKKMNEEEKNGNEMKICDLEIKNNSLNNEITNEKEKKCLINCEIERFKRIITNLEEDLKKIKYENDIKDIKITKISNENEELYKKIENKKIKKTDKNKENSINFKEKEKEFLEKIQFLENEKEKLIFELNQKVETIKELEIKLSSLDEEKIKIAKLNEINNQNNQNKNEYFNMIHKLQNDNFNLTKERDEIMEISMKLQAKLRKLEKEETKTTKITGKIPTYDNFETIENI